MGSVKDLRVDEDPTEETTGMGDFIFSDRFSVFDWGEMPDHIPNKGAALCLMAAWNFERLAQRGISSHYRGVRNFEGKIVKTGSLNAPANEMSVFLSKVVKPEFKNGAFDYSYFKYGRGRINNFVVPLEVIYRNGAPKGSSLFTTLDTLERDGKTNEIQNLLSKYGLNERPKPGDLFPQTGFDFTTKFEPHDRKISDLQAFNISGLTEDQFSQLKEIRGEAVDVVSKRAREVELTDYDGKQEYRIYNGIVSLVDVFGTPDENRFMFNGRQVSKEFLRQVYRREQPDWVKDIGRAKHEAKEKGIEDWKSLVKVQPRKLEPRLVELVGEMYASAADLYTGLKLFGARDLDKVMKDLEPYYQN
ncbi:phosphoribosylaminoimidazolesuccinocarboxamide synthase [Candidatus Pacearchaeota archaeon]|nr:phosphoribosylaminoimidazolesuccinocarboxamide synthase [Candidatus Pacearchaeota archaeon]